MAEPLRIVIADDNYLVREGTRRLLEDSGQVTVQAAVGSAPELLDAVHRTRPEAVLTDIRMPEGPAADRTAGPAMEGIDAAHRIKASTPGVGVVILSQYADESYAFELFRNGTAGLAYLLKDRVGDLRQLLAALREVAAGGSVIDPQVVDALVTRRARLRESPLARLTPRELDVLREMAQGRGKRRHRPGAVPVRVVGGEARQRDLRQARPGQRAAGKPAGRRGPDVPARREPAPAWLTTRHGRPQSRPATPALPRSPPTLLSHMPSLSGTVDM